MRILDLPKSNKTYTVTAAQPEDISEYDRKRVEKYIEKLHKEGFYERGFLCCTRNSMVLGIVWYWTEYTWPTSKDVRRVLKCKIQTHLGTFRYNSMNRHIYKDE